MKLHLVLYYYIRTLYYQWRFRQPLSPQRHAVPHSVDTHRQYARRKLEEWQERQIIRHVHRVRQTSSFYRELWEEGASADWRSFPVIDKQSMMEHFDELNTVGLSRVQAFRIASQAEQTRDFKPLLNGVTVGLSSGTSGNRGLFIVSDREQAAWSGTVLAKLLPGSLLQEEKIAFFLRANSNLYESVKRGRLQFEYFDLLEPVEKLVQRMEEYRPGIWIAPASMLRFLAEACVEGSLTARPRKLISVAEVLDPLDRHYIEEALGQTVHQAYQCTEGFLGTTCKHGTIHMNEDIVHIEKEFLDPDTRRFVPIITDFTRTSQPIIRYRLNDILTEAATTCPCGSVFTAIERIEGRCDDIIYLPHVEGLEPVAVFPDFISRAVITASPNIEHYRVVQTGPLQLEISFLYAESSSTKGEELRVNEELQNNVELQNDMGLQNDMESHKGTQLQKGMQLQNDVELQSVAELQNGVLSQERALLQNQIAEQITALCGKIGCVIPELRFVTYEHNSGAVKLRRVERRWKP
ncbi:Phenylacetate-coenzyme A ligase [compost metagenome]